MNRLEMQRAHPAGASSGRPLLTAAALAVVLLAPAPARAAELLEMDSPVNFFLDRSLILFSPNEIRRAGAARPEAPLLFEAQIAPNLFFPQVAVGDLLTPGGAWFFSAVLTPHIRLRMLNQESSPVIPPSFMPKLTLQVLHLRELGMRAGDDWRRALAFGGHLILGHHSNGQSGCFYANQSGTDPNCTPREGVLPLNEVDGSFSTNFLRGESHLTLVFGIDREARKAWLVGGRLGLELNLAAGPGGITAEQRALHGDGSVDGGVSLERLRYGHLARVAVSLSDPLGGADGQGVTVTAEASFTPRWAAGFGLYGRYVGGRDYYNILFLQPVKLWQFGLVYQLGPGARLREAVLRPRPPAPAAVP